MIPFEIRVLGRNSAKALIQNGWPTCVVGIANTGQGNFIPLAGPHHLKLEFYDVEDQRNDKYDAPKEEQILAALLHTKDLKAGDRLLVHCDMGVSRSTATATGILMQHGMTYDCAYDHIATVARAMRPNALIMRYLDDHFETGGALRSYHQQKIREAQDRPKSGDAAEMQRIMDIFRNGG